jgi:adenosylcobinamide-phosphate synthase
VIPNGVAAAGGWALDVALGEPPARWHPVAWFGTAMTWLERHDHRDHRLAGIVHLAAGVGGAALCGITVQRLIGRTAATVVATAVSVAGRMLTAEAGAVVALVDAGDLDAARARVHGLVGRDVEDLDAEGISRAVIESVAENTVDAVVAPLWWATLGGAPAVLAHRAVNTLDAMVGHHTPRYERFGWASARADDLTNWIPARLGAIAVTTIVPSRWRAILTAVRRDAPAHPSPNGGVIEAAFAAALDVGLGGTNTYGGVAEDRGPLGTGRPPTPADCRSATRLATQVAAATAAALAVGASLAAARRCP